MTVHQVVVDLRVAGARRFFADRAAEEAHQRRLQELRAGIPRNVRYVVGLDASIQVRGGRALPTGSPITVDDVEPDAGFPDQGRSAWQVFRDMVHDERVVENHAWTPPSDTEGARG